MIVVVMVMVEVMVVMVGVEVVVVKVGSSNCMPCCREQRSNVIEKAARTDLGV
jgi:hypothetical protein